MARFWDTNARFYFDWKSSRFDPLADDAAKVFASPWTIESSMLGRRLWMPSASEVKMLLEWIGRTTDTEVDLVPAAVAPALEVTSFNLTREGPESERGARLVVQVTNRGPGAAYRVIAITRSSIASLDRRQLSFGLLRSGATKVRTLQVKIPASETAADTMLVLALREGNGYAPNDVSRRFKIARGKITSALAVQCAIRGRAGEHPELNAGERVLLNCVVSNTEVTPARIELTTVRTGADPLRSAVRDVRGRDVLGRGRVDFDVSIELPSDLAIDSPVEIVVTARNIDTFDTAQTTLVGVVRKPNPCVTGRLTKEQYRAKIAELRAAVSEGSLTTQQFDQYDAALVACLL